MIEEGERRTSEQADLKDNKEVMQSVEEGKGRRKEVRVLNMWGLNQVESS